MRENAPKKVGISFRFDPLIVAELEQSSERSGITKTKMVEDAIRILFGLDDDSVQTRRRAIQAARLELKKSRRPFEFATLPVALAA